MTITRMNSMLLVIKERIGMIEVQLETFKLMPDETKDQDIIDYIVGLMKQREVLEKQEHFLLERIEAEKVADALTSENQPFNEEDHSYANVVTAARQLGITYVGKTKAKLIKEVNDAIATKKTI